MATTKLTIQDYAQALARLGYTFRLNIVTDKVETAKGETLSDPVLRSVRAQMRAEGFGSAEAIEDVIWHLALANRYHPIRAYLTGCGLAYDGGQWIRKLTGYFKDETRPNPLFGLWLRKWLIGAVAKAMGNGNCQNVMLVLDGRQRLGKSFFATWLGSEVPGYFTHGRIDPDNKDGYIRASENWLWETAELGATTRRADIDALKDFISAETITVRRPYAKFETKRPALCSLMGTVNNSCGFLADLTGNRRFMIASLADIDWRYAQEVKVSQVWAEAFIAYKQGEQWLLTSDELALSESNNEGFLVPDPVDGYLVRYFELNPKDMTAWTSTAEIIGRLFDMGYKAASARALAMEAGAALARRGHKECRKLTAQGQMRGYLGISISLVLP